MEGGAYPELYFDTLPLNSTDLDSIHNTDLNVSRNKPLLIPSSTITITIPSGLSIIVAFSYELMVNGVLYSQGTINPDGSATVYSTYTTYNFLPLSVPFTYENTSAYTVSVNLKLEVTGTNSGSVTHTKIAMSDIINLYCLNATGYNLSPIVGRFGYLNGIISPLDINDKVVVSPAKQVVYELSNYTDYATYLSSPIDWSIYQVIGTFTIDSNNEAVFTSTIGITELEHPVVRTLAP